MTAGGNIARLAILGANTSNTASVTVTWPAGFGEEPPLAPVPAWPEPCPPSLPPALAAVRAPDAAWEVPAWA